MGIDAYERMMEADEEDSKHYLNELDLLNNRKNKTVN
jgi:hypothetical protein